MPCWFAACIRSSPALPFAPGIECAGTIAALGESVEGFSVGDRVAAMKSRHLLRGCHSSASHTYAIPDGLDFDHAGAMLCAHGTAYHALVQQAALRPGETLLVPVRRVVPVFAAVQIGHALGAQVIAACSSEDKMRIAKQHGADIAIHTGENDVREAVKSLTGGAARTLSLIR